MNFRPFSWIELLIALTVTFVERSSESGDEPSIHVVPQKVECVGEAPQS